MSVMFFLNEKWIQCVICQKQEKKGNSGLVEWCTHALIENKLIKIHSYAISASARDLKVVIMLETVQIIE